MNKKNMEKQRRETKKKNMNKKMKQEEGAIAYCA